MHWRVKPNVQTSLHKLSVCQEVKDNYLCTGRTDVHYLKQQTLFRLKLHLQEQFMVPEQGLFLAFRIQMRAELTPKPMLREQHSIHQREGVQATRRLLNIT